MTYEEALALVTRSGRRIGLVPEHLVDEKMCFAAVINTPWVLPRVPVQHCKAAEAHLKLIGKDAG